ncbi:hypothetical protein PYCC9005_000151 [Savitreella phatthalungensis]
MLQRIRYLPGPRCGVGGCKARQYYRLDGQTFCRNNHLVVGEFLLETEEDEVHASGVGSRRKVVREGRLSAADARRQSKAAELLYGAYLRAARLQAHQCILRTQIEQLSSFYDIPDLEIVARDLWARFCVALRVDMMLPEGLDAAATEDDAGIGLPESSQVADEAVAVADEEGDDDALPIAIGSQPALRHLFALSYLSLMSVQAPVELCALRQHLVDGRITYLRAIKAVPPELRRKLPREERSQLDPPVIPTVRYMWRGIRAVIKTLVSGGSWSPPRINTSGLLYTQARHLLIPLHFATAAGDVLCAHEMLLDGMNAGAWYRIERGQPDLPPETRTAAMLLVLVRLATGQDRLGRKSMLESTLYLTSPNFELWGPALEQRLTALRSQTGAAARTRPEDVYSMNDNQVDDYLRWYKQTYAIVDDSPAGGEWTGRARQNVLQMFDGHMRESLSGLESNTARTRRTNKPEDEDESIMSTIHARVNPRLMGARPLGTAYRATLDKQGRAHLVDGSTSRSATVMNNLVDLAAQQLGILREDIMKQMAWVERQLHRACNDEGLQNDE